MDFPDLFGNIKAEDIATFELIPETDCLFLTTELSIFKVVSKKVRDNLFFVVPVNHHIF